MKQLPINKTENVEVRAYLEREAPLLDGFPVSQLESFLESYTDEEIAKLKDNFYQGAFLGELFNEAGRMAGLLPTDDEPPASMSEFVGRARSRASSPKASSLIKSTTFHTGLRR